MAILAWFVVEILNILLLREVIAVAQAFRLLRGKRKELHSVFCFWGMVDVLCSVAELREELPYHTRPTDCREGESFLKDTQIWVCTVCGFVYVGDQAPELCPVCKVPAWKFEKVERRVPA